MGAVFGKAKPVADSARNVIARRKKELPQTVSNSVDNAMSLRSSSQVSTGSENPDFSPEVLLKMSNWGGLVKTTTLKSPTVAGAKIEMASMIRHAEDKLKLKSSQGIAGRLTEVQIIQLFSELKYSEKSFQQLGTAFFLTESDVKKLSRIARIPVVYTDKQTDEILAK